MHILLIHQAFASLSEPGGTRHYEFGCHCIPKGHRFTIVGSNLNYLTGTPPVSSECPESEQKSGAMHVLPARTFPALHPTFFWRIVSYLSFMLSSVKVGLSAGPVDLVMGTSPPIFQAVSAWLVAWLRRRPFLLEIRDLWPEFAIDMGILRNPFLITLSRWLEQFLYSRAVHIVVNSPAYIDYLTRKGLAAEKITLIPNGVDTSMFDCLARGEDVRRSFDLDGKFVVTYAGALGLANDIPTILRAAHRLREHGDIRFLLVGDGKERPRIEASAKELRLPNLVFAGAQPKSAIPAILAASDACVATLRDIPMFRTTYPNKVFDYMAAGRPTILAIDGVIRQVIEAAQGGLYVPPGDDAAIADAVLSLRNDAVKAKAMGLAAQNYVAEHFDRKNQAEAFLTLAMCLAGK